MCNSTESTFILMAVTALSMMKALLLLYCAQEKNQQKKQEFTVAKLAGEQRINQPSPRPPAPGHQRARDGGLRAGTARPSGPSGSSEARGGGGRGPALGEVALETGRTVPAEGAAAAGGGGAGGGLASAAGSCSGRAARRDPRDPETPRPRGPPRPRRPPRAAAGKCALPAAPRAGRHSGFEGGRPWGKEWRVYWASTSPNPAPPPPSTNKKQWPQIWELQVNPGLWYPARSLHPQPAPPHRTPPSPHTPSPHTTRITPPPTSCVSEL
ncbi:basic salivary proline-rich protein 3-like [Canis lupus familiaris]|uniref:basic salivary proline-rich protein 3-like n=1 Tax=Canis lupus familiaris TaxID=9615 RepID=UPI0018F7AFF0|nr:basic salivary proline-rich protein 3-like [Canis lupus familiaris]